ncbi:N-formylglutamate amidohydrolase [Rhodobacter sp. TJ_12]|uniref:N-formylglutamate amidohydrolase n=1 Tax=Rhodobacter sp. TJ_12 TaxID=2029399 RepID=UPI001CBF1D34|nr:N-formylglutamate amidohydrolase [Rhodobacter sp. TJ_12]MBZ4023623.1 N-formylglutamate amidohydrolase [Rhodobacter sp. TJ_12]
MPEAAPSILPYRLHLPEVVTSGVVFASPHSGRFYPQDFVRDSQLDLLRLRSSEDAFVDKLLSAVPGHGGTLLEALYPRAYVDLNRSEDELDPALIEGVARGSGGSRAAMGLGVIPRVVAGGREIGRGKMPRTAAQSRIRAVWRPYHARLQALLEERRDRFGRTILFDVHSMPSEASTPRQRCAEIVLGDRFGTSASAETMARVESVFRRAGLTLARNSPFAGAYIVSRYGRPASGVEVVQIEISRALYMDEEQIEPLPQFELFATLIGAITGELSDLVRAEDSGQLAAE